MTDDLVKRLEQSIKMSRADYWEVQASMWHESYKGVADRIEKLEADLEIATMKRILDADRIEKLEAALAKVADGYETEWSTSSVTNMLDIAQILSERIVIARKALEGKDD